MLLNYAVLLAILCLIGVILVPISRESSSFAVLDTATALLFVAWLIGFTSGYTLGGVIHLLLAFAILLCLVRIAVGALPTTNSF